MLVHPPTAVLHAASANAAAPRRRIGTLAWIAIVLALLAPFAFYFGTVRSIVAIWDSSETFAHGYIILPISLWLIWRRRENFVSMPPQPYWPALLLLVLVIGGWLLARMGEVQVVMQYTFAAMLPVIALAVLGRPLAQSLTFPLLFVLLAVPFGDIFIDPLINFTADFTVWALQATGIPVLRNGTRFEIPSGSWSVVEACSGVRYLISSITLGCLYAYMTYRSTWRRIAFIGVAIIVPIVANGMRAYMIVMIGHLSGMKLAVGFDHLIYGWLFFGLVMFLMFWIGSLWREDPPVPAAQVTPTLLQSQVAATAEAMPVTTQARLPAAIPSANNGIVAIAVAVVALLAAGTLFARFNDSVTANPNPVQLQAAAINLPRTAAFAPWQARFAPADAQVDAVYSAAPSAAPADGAAPHPVALSMLYYRNQRNDKAVISSTNRLANEKDDYHVLNSTVRSEAIGARTLAVRESTVQANNGSNILVWNWYWIDGDYTASNIKGKLLQARAKLLFRGDDGAAIILSTPVSGGVEASRKVLHDFTAANLAALDASLNAARSH